MADMNDDVKGIIASIGEIQTDAAMPKNVKEKLNEVIGLLKGTDENSINVSKALDKIEEIADDSNLQPYTRTQIWNIASLLESL
ncbi:MAG: UPF0147 family protein [Candidatus Woesearchaeota archaeon]|nr:UPF0147 family protein [Candidatus Woesearchaeota archaeon]